uniref:NADAR domain-containing protein n=1 Tax=Bicosoecida sp. CB-2014 TaxID=1486930 RepID=A0A7S1CBA1_9STRA|mmetsp:Transcript_2038/g.6567  ORF Transcript_2038/g.6567 Transcript_2038/m.6567 type:complete len:309 (+) Transcript_2038:129-1055(+)
MAEAREGKDKGGDGSSEGCDATRFAFFWRAGSPFSNFHPARFSMVVRQPGLAGRVGDDGVVVGGGGGGVDGGGGDDKEAARTERGTRAAGRRARGGAGGGGAGVDDESIGDAVEFTYFCSEQAMMHGKALLFGDFEAARLVMAATKPGQCKSIGRKVRGFNDGTWKKYRVPIVYAATSCKFSQRKDLRAAMDATRGRTLVEAAPRDRIWGIGLGEAAAKAMPPAEWPGQNLLGATLTRLRDDMTAGTVPARGISLDLPVPDVGDGAVVARAPTKRERKRGEKKGGGVAAPVVEERRTRGSGKRRRSGD